jgi:hypothetical protein
MMHCAQIIILNLCIWNVAAIKYVGFEVKVLNTIYSQNGALALCSRSF